MNQQELKTLLHYDPPTGVFRWRFGRKNGQTQPWSEAGYYNSHGYRVIMVNHKPYPAHRLAWLYMTGEWPGKEVDHKNLIRDDNRWGNLRSASVFQNQWNTGLRSTNTSGVKGVYFDKRKQKWIGSFRANGLRFYTEGFGSSAEAAQALTTLREANHGEFARAN